MHLLLIAGFLGSGKTTLIIQLAKAARAAGRRVAIIVNEIGEIGIDDQLMRQLALDVWELVSGCICCTLTGDLITTLQMLDREFAPDLVILEPSGVAEPGNILKMLPYYQGRPLASICSLTLIDPLRLPMLYEVLTPLITAQIQHADLLLVTKADIATADEIALASQIASELNPAAALFCASVKDPLDPRLTAELLP